MAYFARVIDQELIEALQIYGAVVLDGPKWCGKTSAALQVCKSAVRFDIDLNSRRLASEDPGYLLQGKSPRLFDEWQMAPEIWNQVRHNIDTEQSTGAFVLTGSLGSQPQDGSHTGTGRFHFLQMRTMSLFESGVSSGAISLNNLSGLNISITQSPKLSLETLLELICVGGWPELHGTDPTIAAKRVRSYSKSLTTRDLLEASSGRSPLLATKILKSLARNVATEVRISTIAKDISSGGAAVKEETISGYLALFNRMMITEDLEPWAIHMRSSYQIRRSPKRYFTDPSIAAALLLATPEKLRKDLELSGLLFENLVIRDLRIYAQTNGARVCHYRDASGLEVDAIIEHYDGSWGAIEIKLGESSIDDAAASLLKFRDRVDTSKQSDPDYLAVLTNTSESYTRRDGVHVISITAIGP